MGFLDRLFGRSTASSAGYGQRAGSPAGYPQQGYGQGQAGGAQPSYAPVGGQTGTRTADQQAIARYRYLLQTAAPEDIERAHAEAFAQLTPEQRRIVLNDIAAQTGERAAGDDPQSLARAATRAELRRPGFLERTFAAGSFGGMGGMGMGGMGMGGYGGMSMGRVIGGSMLGTIAGMVIGTAVADVLMDGFDLWDRDTHGGELAQGYDGLDGATGDYSADGVTGNAADDISGDQSWDGSGGSGFDDGTASGDSMVDTSGLDTTDAGWGGDSGFYDAGSDLGGFDGGGFDGGGFDSF